MVGIVNAVIPYQSKLSPRLQDVPDRGRRMPSVIVPSAEGPPAASPLSPEDWYDATEQLFKDSEHLADGTPLDQAEHDKA